MDEIQRPACVGSRLDQDLSSCPDSLAPGLSLTDKDLNTLGMGVETSRALERVEVDEYTLDLFVLIKDSELFDHLPQSIENLISLDGRACRVTLSGAIDVHTRCFLALEIVPNGVESPLAQTLEMIYMDKSPVADAAGATFGWPMGSAPEAIVSDRGDNYITDEAYDILADLGITNLGCPAGKPWLRAFIERVFPTFHCDLLLRFSGRAFSNVVERGENDGGARATLTLETFLCWLVRWVVDAYHTRKHDGIGMTPAKAWEMARRECPPRSLTSAEMREETEEATDIGFSIYSEGPDAVEEALDTIRQTSPANAVQAGPLAYYGAIFDWLDRRSNSIDPGPIRDILRNHIVKHSAVEPGTTVLGVEIPERRYHTLYSLAAVVGIDRPRLSRLLKKLGEIPANTTEVDCGRMVF